MHSAYAEKYFGSRRWDWLSLLHFVLRGEAAGYQANPFVKRLTGVRLGEYLRRPGLRMLPPSPDFDPEFYAQRSCLGPEAHPLVHFWRQGFDENVPPTSSFDLNFFKQAIAKFRPDKKALLFELLADNRTSHFPRNERELAERQISFRKSIELLICKQTPPVNRDLVFIQASENYKPPFDNVTGSFDIMLNIYNGTKSFAEECVNAVICQSGTKATAIYKLMTTHPELLVSYDAVFFLDDDVEIDADSIVRSFELFRREKLDVAQPSLSADSACAFEILKQPLAGSGVRPISAVEIMMPIISRRALLNCFSAFKEAISGWGVDSLLCKMVREQFGETVALLSDIEARHIRHFDVASGAYYMYLAKYGIDPFHELGSIAYRHGLSVVPENYCSFV